MNIKYYVVVTVDIIKIYSYPNTSSFFYFQFQTFSISILKNYVYTSFYYSSYKIVEDINPS